MILEAALLIRTLVLSGGYAGLVLMVWIGILPGLLLLSPEAYADAWRAMDRRVPSFKGALLLLSLATLVCLALGSYPSLAAAVGISLLLSVIDVALTVRYQLP